MIEDCDTVDIVRFIIGLFSEALGEEEDRVITVGTGVGQPTGYASGGLGIQCQAVGGNLGFDDIIDLIYLLPAKWKKAASFYVHKNNIRELRKLKDSENRYIWMDSPAPGQPSTIYGYPVIEDNNLSEAEIYFGDLKKAYYLGDRKRMTVKISNDESKAFEQDQTAIRVVQRVAGTVVRPTGLKCLNSIP